MNQRPHTTPPPPSPMRSSPTRLQKHTRHLTATTHPLAGLNWFLHWDDLQTQPYQSVLQQLTAFTYLDPTKLEIFRNYARIYNIYYME